MRIAFISDIHGNLHALDLVLADLEKARVDHIVCLGDVASLGPHPREVIARLRQLPIACIMGNHETYLLNLRLTEKHHAWLQAVEQWCLAQLTTDDLNFLGAFQPRLNFALAPDTLALCFHGSPRSNEEWIFPTTPSETLDDIFTAPLPAVLVGGHTHVQMVRQHNGALLLNPGSVGMPFEFPQRGPRPKHWRWAEYAILEMAEGKLTTQLQRLPIDFEYLAQTARASGLPGIEFWLASWLVSEHAPPPAQS